MTDELHIVSKLCQQVLNESKLMRQEAIQGTEAAKEVARRIKSGELSFDRNYTINELLCK